MDTATTKYWNDRATAASVDLPERLEDLGHYEGVDTLYEVALPPVLTWDEAAQKEAVARISQELRIEPHQWVEIDDDPVGSLWTEGSWIDPEFEPCPKHHDCYYSSEAEQIYDPDDPMDCVDCLASCDRKVDQMAVWHYTVDVTVWERRIGPDGSIDDFVYDTYKGMDVAEVEQVPRDLLIGPPGRGRHW